MAGRKYQVKFYGFTAEDAEAFCRNLAGLLTITPEAAWDLLMEAPLVIKKDLDKTAAQQLVESLAGIQALCLVEPMDGSFVEEEAPPRQPLSVPEEEPEKARKKDLFGYRIWSGVIVVAVAVLVGFGLIAYWGTYMKLNRGVSPAALPAADDSSKEALESRSESPGASYYELQNRIDDLAGRLEVLETDAKVLESEIKSTAGELGTDPLETRKKQQTLRGLRTQIESIQAELRSLGSRREEMEAKR